MSRTVNSIRNISFGIMAQVIQMVLSFVSRTIFVKYLAIEYLGINSLFTNILAMLSLAELGVGSACIFALYKPLAEKDEFSISTILQFFKKIYWIIGLTIFISGLLLIPFLNDIIPQKPSLVHEDIRFIYLIFLFNTASSYFFSYKVFLLNADQQSSVSSFYSMIFLIIQNFLQILVVVFTQNFLAYLLVQSVILFSNNWYISNLVDKKYSYLKKYKTGVIDRNLRKTILSNTKSSFMIKIGGVLVNGTDNIFINLFVGLALLGKYSNYLMLVALISNFTAIIFANLSSSIAHFLVTENKKRQNEMFISLNFLNFWIFGVCSVMIIFLSNDFIKIWLGENFLLDKKIPFMMAVNFFMVGMQNGFWTFKSAYGFFRQGRYIVLLTALLNLILSYILGKHFGIFGILLATALARLVTNFWYDPYIVLKFGLLKKPIGYLSRFTKYILVLILASCIIFFIFGFFSNTGFYFLILKTLVSFSILNGTIVLFFRNHSEFKDAVAKLKNASITFYSKLPIINKK